MKTKERPHYFTDRRTGVFTSKVYDGGRRRQHLVLAVAVSGDYPNIRALVRFFDYEKMGFSEEKLWISWADVHDVA